MKRVIIRDEGIATSTRVASFKCCIKEANGLDLGAFIVGLFVDIADNAIERMQRYEQFVHL